MMKKENQCVYNKIFMNTLSQRRSFLSRKINPNLNGNRYSQWKLLQESTSME